MENLEMRHLLSGSGFQAFLIPARKQCTATGITFHMGGKADFSSENIFANGFHPLSPRWV